MTSRANLYMQIPFFRGTCLKTLATGAGYCNLVVFWVNSGFHFSSPRSHDTSGKPHFLKQEIIEAQTRLVKADGCPGLSGGVSRTLLLTELAKSLDATGLLRGGSRLLLTPENQIAKNVSLHRAGRWHPQKLIAQRFSSERESPPVKPGASNNSFHTISIAPVNLSNLPPAS